ncbi:MAG: 50S ribosomal protein L21 [Pirellulales bacterium]
MYAIIADSGRQYKVSEGQILDVDFRDASVGDKIQFDRVLALSGEAGVQIGKPVVSGAAVAAEVLGVTMGPKLVVQKFRRRKNSRRRTGHRQMFTRVRIDKINV